MGGVMRLEIPPVAAEFSDYLLGSVSQDAGASVTYTFDRALRDEPGFALL